MSVEEDKFSPVLEFTLAEAFFQNGNSKMTHGEGGGEVGLKYYSIDTWKNMGENLV